MGYEDIGEVRFVCFMREKVSKEVQPGTALTSKLRPYYAIAIWYKKIEVLGQQALLSRLSSSPRNAPLSDPGGIVDGTTAGGTEPERDLGG